MQQDDLFRSAVKKKKKKKVANSRSPVLGLMYTAIKIKRELCGMLKYSAGTVIAIDDGSFWHSPCE